MMVAIGLCESIMRALLFTLICLLHIPAYAGLFDQASPSTSNVFNNSSDFLPVEQAFKVQALENSDGSVAIRFSNAQGYYLYRHRLAFSTESAGVSFGDAQLPNGKARSDEFFGDIEAYYGTLDITLIYGVTVGKYNFKVIKQRIFFPDLPDAFDGFTITHISDVHSGSFDNAEKINYAIDLINEQNSDMILFTGDIVNTAAKEMYPWIDTFNRIKKHEYGKYSVLGNHDYGEYVTWPTEQAKEENFEAIKNLYGQIGFKLMLNEHTFIQKGEDKIALVGVENWGHNFKQVGDLKKAAGTLKKEEFKILMTHDPSHWDRVVQHDDKNFHLTLSGHTHGMQFGIEIPGYFKWSLAQYVYKQWAGLYENLGRYIYVNRGFGFHAYPGRVGIMPEITVIQLKKGVNVA